MKTKKLLAGILSVSMLLSVMATPAFADETEEADALAVVAEADATSGATLLTTEESPAPSDDSSTVNSNEHDISQGDVTLALTGDVTHKVYLPENAEPIRAKIEIDVKKSEDGTNPTVILANLKNFPKNSGYSDSGYADFVTVRIETGATLYLELDGENNLTRATNTSTVETGYLYKKEVNDSGQYDGNYNGTLVIQDKNDIPGCITAKGSYSAAIGGTQGSWTTDYYSGVHNITITGGTINAVSSYGAAIGGGNTGAAENIVIEGGLINATGSYGAAIGSGSGSSSSSDNKHGLDAQNIIINGGTVNATGSYGAAIGSGQRGNAKNIVISGGTVTAVGSSGGAAIGSGQEGDVDGITIRGDAVVTAGGAQYYSTGAAIGCGSGKMDYSTQVYTPSTAKNISITDDASVEILPGSWRDPWSHEIPGYVGAAIGAGNLFYGDYQNGGHAENITIDTTGTVTVAASRITFGGTTKNISIKTGSFQNDISAFFGKGYMVKNENGTYTVAKAETKVSDSASFGGVTVTLDRLDQNDKVDLTKGSSVSVVITKAPQADAEAANEIIKDTTADTNTAKQIFDISIIEDNNGISNTLDVRLQPVTITIDEILAPGSAINVYHVDGVTGDAEKVDSVTNGNQVSFTASSFSTYAFTYTPAPVAQNDITSEVGVVFSKVDGTDNEYYINLKALDYGKTINRFMATDLVFKNECATVDYEIEPAVGVTASLISTKDNSREYRLNLDGLTTSGVSGKGITIGKVVFEGYGQLDFSIDTAYVSAGTEINVIQTAKDKDNIVDSYKGANLIVNAAANHTAYPTTIADDESGVINDTIKVETKKLTVNVIFNNNVENQNNAYQDMKITISGGDLAADKVIELGTDTHGNEYSYATDANGVHYYNVYIKDVLTKNTAYTVTVSGAGYRTARYTVTMTADKTLNFWNNVKSAVAYIEEGVGTAKTSNFLAGDIVKDGKINIYDLSAVVSYFGKVNNVSAASANAKYDLNRDGVIDSKDVAYVLVSWGE